MAYAVVRLSKNRRIEDGVFKYTESSFPNINYNMLFDVLFIPNEDRDKVTFGYTKMDCEPIEFSHETEFVLVDSDKCKVFGETDYYSWTDFIFFMESDEVADAFASLSYLKETKNNRMMLKKSDKVQVLFIMSEQSIVKKLEQKDVEKYYNKEFIGGM